MKDGSAVIARYSGFYESHGEPLSLSSTSSLFASASAMAASTSAMSSSPSLLSLMSAPRTATTSSPYYTDDYCETRYGSVNESMVNSTNNSSINDDNNNNSEQHKRGLSESAEKLGRLSTMLAAESDGAASAVPDDRAVASTSADVDETSSTHSGTSRAASLHPPPQKPPRQYHYTDVRQMTSMPSAVASTSAAASGAPLRQPQRPTIRIPQPPPSQQSHYATFNSFTTKQQQAVYAQPHRGFASTSALPATGGYTTTTTFHASNASDVITTTTLPRHSQAVQPPAAPRHYTTTAMDSSSNSGTVFPAVLPFSHYNSAPILPNNIGYQRQQQQYALINQQSSNNQKYQQQQLQPYSTASLQRCRQRGGSPGIGATSNVEALSKMSDQQLFDVACAQQRQVDANACELEERQRLIAATIATAASSADGAAQSQPQRANNTVRVKCRELRARIARDERELSRLGGVQREARALAAHNQTQRRELSVLEQAYANDDTQLRLTVERIDVLRKQLDVLHQRRASAASAAIAQQRKVNGETNTTATSASIGGGTATLPSLINSNKVQQQQQHQQQQQRPKASVVPFQFKNASEQPDASLHKDYCDMSAIGKKPHCSPAGYAISDTTESSRDHYSSNQHHHQHHSATSTVNKKTRVAPPPPPPPSSVSSSALCPVFRNSSQSQPLPPPRYGSSVYGAYDQHHYEQQRTLVARLQADQLSLRADSLTAIKRRSWALADSNGNLSVAGADAGIQPLLQPSSGTSDQPNNTNVWRYLAEEQRKGRTHISFADIMDAKRAAAAADSASAAPQQLSSSKSSVLPLPAKVHPLCSLLKTSAFHQPASTSVAECATVAANAEVQNGDANTVSSSRTRMSAADDNTNGRGAVPDVAALEEPVVVERPKTPLPEPTVTEEEEEVNTNTITTGSDSSNNSSAASNNTTTIEVSEEEEENNRSDVREDNAVGKSVERGDREQINNGEMDSTTSNRGKDEEEETVPSGNEDARGGTIIWVTPSLVHGRPDEDVDNDDDEERPDFEMMMTTIERLDEAASTTDEACSTVSGGDEPVFDERSLALPPGTPQPKGILRPPVITRHKRRVVFDHTFLLLDMAYGGEYEAVVELAAKMPDISVANEDGLTALHNAICAGNLEIVSFLVDNRADVNALDFDGWSPLHCAASCNNFVILRQLIENGACVYAMTLRTAEIASDLFYEPHELFNACADYAALAENCMGVVNDGKVYAAFSYDAENEDELSFAEGDVLRVIHRNDHNVRSGSLNGSDEEDENGVDNDDDDDDDEEEPLWWLCERLTTSDGDADGCDDGKEERPAPRKRGLVPRNYLSLYPTWRARERLADTFEMFELPRRYATLTRFQRRRRNRQHLMMLQQQQQHQREMDGEEEEEDDDDDNDDADGEEMQRRSIEPTADEEAEVHAEDLQREETAEEGDKEEKAVREWKKENLMEETDGEQRKTVGADSVASARTTTSVSTYA